MCTAPPSYGGSAGFQPAASVSRYALLGATDLLVPKPPAAVAGSSSDRYSDASSTAVSALARALALDAMVGVARLVYQKNAAPKLGLLVPGLSPEGLSPAVSTALLLTTHVAFPSPVGSDCLFFLPLPFAEDVRHFTFAAFPEAPQFAPSDPQLAAADALISALDLTSVVSEPVEVQSCTTCFMCLRRSSASLAGLP